MVPLYHTEMVYYYWNKEYVSVSTISKSLDLQILNGKVIEKLKVIYARIEFMTQKKGNKNTGL